jgi:6-phosphofructokinase 1
MGGACPVLDDFLSERLEGAKIRCIDLSLMQRCSSHLASPVDLSEAKVLGAISLSRAMDGVTGEVAVLTRVSDNPYRVEYSTVHATTIANLEKAIPRDWINERGNFVTETLIEYVPPLLGDDMGGYFVP